MPALRVMGRPKKGITVEDRFWKRVRKTRKCWLWTGYTPNGRYGALIISGRRVLAHRFSFKLARGWWSKGLTLHTCDVPLCVKPNHLYDGSQTRNMHDWLTRRGRKLTTKQALWCKGKPVQSIINKFDVFWTHAYALRRGAYWRWV